MAQDSTKLLSDPQKRSVLETLLQYSIDPKIARDVALVELRNFSPAELRAIYGKLRKTGVQLKSIDFAWPNLLVGFRNLALSLTGVKALEQPTVWLKPPKSLVEQSAERGQALCVNALGQWSLRVDGYFAISHVWEEGIQADPENRGIPLAHMQQIIRRIRAVTVPANTGTSEADQWIWLDGLAIPAGNRSLTLKEEELKIAIINTLPAIYKNAAMVIIFDALVMQLRSTDHVEVAVCLITGKWLTRVWTYQEIYLARKAAVLTATGYVDFFDMLRRLRAISENENHMPEIFGASLSHALDVARPSERNQAKYEELYLTLVRLWGTADDLKPSLGQIAMSCHNRKTGNDIDYARAFFPVLRLKWRVGLSREEGMHMIYMSDQWHAKRLILMHGQPRTAFVPGWAPSYLTGLTGRLLGPDMPLGDIEWQKRGLKRTWYTHKVIERLETDKEHGILLRMQDGEGQVLYGCLLATNERAEAISGFADAIQRKCAYLLSDRELIFPSSNGLAYPVLLVERNEDVTDMDEAWVHMTAEVVAAQNKTSPADTVSWLLLHENPLGTQIANGKSFSELARLLSDEEAFHTGQTPLHTMANMGQLDGLRNLLDAKDCVIDVRDDRGWTPLHFAAFSGQVATIDLLVQRGAAVDALDAIERSPLMLAADEGHADSVRTLIRHGADIQRSSKNAACPLQQALLRGHYDAAHVLIEAGAHPQGKDRHGLDTMLLLFKQEVRFAELLFSAGADPMADLVGGTTLLHFAARAGNAPLVERLLELDVPVDLPETGDMGGETALSRAIEEHHEDVVALLLKHGADPNIVLMNGWTSVLRAAQLGHYDMIKMLLHRGSLDINAACRPEGWTALHVAARSGHRLVVRLLLDKGWRLYDKDTEGRTPMDLAEAAGHSSTLEVLRRAEKDYM